MKKTYSVLLSTGHKFVVQEKFVFEHGFSYEQDGKLFDNVQQNLYVEVKAFSFAIDKAVAYFN